MARVERVTGLGAGLLLTVLIIDVSILRGAATFGIRGNHARAWGNAPMPRAPASIRVTRRWRPRLRTPSWP